RAAIVERSARQGRAARHVPSARAGSRVELGAPPREVRARQSRDVLALRAGQLEARGLRQDDRDAACAWSEEEIGPGSIDPLRGERPPKNTAKMAWLVWFDVCNGPIVPVRSKTTLAVGALLLMGCGGAAKH